MKLKPPTLIDTVSMLDELRKEVEGHISKETHENTKNTIQMARHHIQQAIVVLETVASDKRAKLMEDIQNGKVFKR